MLHVLVDHNLWSTLPPLSRPISHRKRDEMVIFLPKSLISHLIALTRSSSHLSLVLYVMTTTT